MRTVIFSVISRIKSVISVFRKGNFRLRDRVSTPRGMVVILLSLIVVVVLVFGIMIYGFNNHSKISHYAAAIIPYPVALVNWSPVLLRDYYFTEKYTRHFYEANKSPYDASTVNRQIIDQLIDQKIWEQQAVKYSIKITDEDVDQAYQTLIDKNGKDEVEKVLQEMYGLTEDNFKKLIYPQVLKKNIETTLKQKNEWREAQVRHILVKVDQNAEQRLVDEAHHKADERLNEIKGGKSFDAVAKDHSEDKESKDQGGELGYISREKTVKEFGDAVFGKDVKKGDLLGPVRTQYGWHIILIEDIKGSNEYTIWRNSSKIIKLIEI